MDKTPVRGAKENPRLRPPRGKRDASLRTPPTDEWRAFTGCP